MTVPDLAAYDAVLVASSGGKDSQAMLDYIDELAIQAGIRDRVTVVHNDLGAVEWPGTVELAREQAEHYGFRFELCHREQGLLLDQIRARKQGLLRRADEAEARGDLVLAAKLRATPAWPSAAARYCTSDQKRGPTLKLVTRLVRELGIEWHGSPPRPVRQARVLYCLGIRAEESTGRARKAELTVDRSATTGVREVTQWHPILHWSERQVWERIWASGVRYHWAYDAGMRRLSCSFCVLASREDLVCAARLRPELAAEYVALEQELGHTFTADLSMADIVAAANATGPAATPSTAPTYDLMGAR
ncbi:phosphoadenosine phosphosulfate reductase domain-containing protein (plasmid) [Streptomyces sp. SDT5-1]|uniref:phosphoadenosine phosphosulfate reductase domain-containing protein n=1 Tax=Streptomyces sp. SDT5-1 TaxID=3406418 RepID=UPI003FD11219